MSFSSSMTKEELRLADDLSIGALPMWPEVNNGRGPSSSGTRQGRASALYNLGADTSPLNSLRNEPWMPRNQQMNTLWSPPARPPPQTVYQPPFSMRQPSYSSGFQSNRVQSSWNASNVTLPPNLNNQCAHSNGLRGVVLENSYPSQGALGQYMDGASSASVQMMHPNEGIDQAMHQEAFTQYRASVNIGSVGNAIRSVPVPPSQHTFNHSQDFRNRGIKPTYVGPTGTIPCQGLFGQSRNLQRSGPVGPVGPMMTSIDANSGTLSQNRFNPHPDFQTTAPPTYPNSPPTVPGITTGCTSPYALPPPSTISTISTSSQEYQQLEMALEALQASSVGNEIPDISFGSFDLNQSFDSLSVYETAPEDDPAQNEPLDSQQHSMPSPSQLLADLRGNATLAQGTHSMGPTPRVLPQGRLVSPQGRLVSPQGRLVSPQGRLVSPQGRLVSPQGRLVSPQGRLVSNSMAPDNILGGNSGSHGIVDMQGLGGGCGHGYASGRGAPFLPQRSRSDMSHITCHYCGELGHKINSCVRKKAVLKSPDIDNKVVHAQEQLNATANAAGDRRGNNGNTFRRPKSYGPPAMSLSEVAAVKCQNTAHTE